MLQCSNADPSRARRVDCPHCLSLSRGLGAHHEGPIPQRSLLSAAWVAEADGFSSGRCNCLVALAPDRPAPTASSATGLARLLQLDCARSDELGPGWLVRRRGALPIPPADLPPHRLALLHPRPVLAADPLRPGCALRPYPRRRFRLIAAPVLIACAPQFDKRSTDPHRLRTHRPRRLPR